MTKFAKLACAAALASLACVLPARAQTVALTFDDGPTVAPTPLLSPEQRNQAMLDALAKHHIKSVLFVTAGNGAHQPRGYALAKAWGDAGHVIGNHTMTHIDLNKVALDQYQKEILDCDAIIRTLPGYQKWFRYTFINLGDTQAKRDGMRAFLAREGYRDAPVSFDVQDWNVDAALMDLLKKDPKADVTPIKTAYLADVKKRAQAAMDPAKAPLDEVRVMLLHHNLPNALWLDEVIGVLEAQGWKFTPASAVLASYR